MTRTFEDKPATRERVPMLVGLVGPSGGGKTYSALRLATGMQRVTGGEIYYIDTESRRALHYADEFKFRHVEMRPPFSSLDYLDAIRHCVRQMQAGVLIIDSMSHEHEGEGGMLDAHDKELDRMAGDDYGKRNKMTFTAWAKPKAERRKLINEILQLGVNVIFCFRAKEKLKIVAGRNPMPLGWQPISGDEFIYEMSINCLLYPKAGGVPNWAPDEAGEKIMLKKPENLAHVFIDGMPLSEDTGEGLARWAEGEKEDVPDNDKLPRAIREIQAATSVANFAEVMQRWSDHPWSDADKLKLRDAAVAVREVLSKEMAETSETRREDDAG